MQTLYRRRAAILLCACVLGSCGGFDSDSTPAPTTPESCPAPRRPIETTLQDIMAAKFRTAIDKIGTCGIYVTARHLKVLAVVPMEDDGDWHVEVTDGKVPVFITEIIPRDQHRVGKPPVDSYIDETGTAYDDLAADGRDHQYTPWEIHPVTSWTFSHDAS